MVDGGVGQRAGQVYRGSGQAPDLVQSKLRRPVTRPPLLATHLSFPEIGAVLFLSPNTVKSQAMSLYRKLGANSRSQAVARSRELALLDE